MILPISRNLNATTSTDVATFYR